MSAEGQTKDVVRKKRKIRLSETQTILYKIDFSQTMHRHIQATLDRNRETLQFAMKTHILIHMLAMLILFAATVLAGTWI